MAACTLARGIHLGYPQRVGHCKADVAALAADRCRSNVDDLGVVTALGARKLEPARQFAVFRRDLRGHRHASLARLEIDVATFGDERARRGKRDRLPRIEAQRTRCRTGASEHRYRCHFGNGDRVIGLQEQVAATADFDIARHLHRAACAQRERSGTGEGGPAIGERYRIGGRVLHRERIGFSHLARRDTGKFERRLRARTAKIVPVDTVAGHAHRADRYRTLGRERRATRRLERELLRLDAQRRQLAADPADAAVDRYRELSGDEVDALQVARLQRGDG